LTGFFIRFNDNSVVTAYFLGPPCINRQFQTHRRAGQGVERERKREGAVMTPCVSRYRRSATSQSINQSQAGNATHEQSVSQLLTVNGFNSPPATLQPLPLLRRPIRLSTAIIYKRVKSITHSHIISARLAIL